MADIWPAGRKPLRSKEDVGSLAKSSSMCKISMEYDPKVALKVHYLRMRKEAPNPRLPKNFRLSHSQSSLNKPVEIRPVGVQVSHYTFRSFPARHAINQWISDREAPLSRSAPMPTYSAPVYLTPKSQESPDLVTPLGVYSPPKRRRHIRKCGLRKKRRRRRGTIGGTTAAIAQPGLLSSSQRVLAERTPRRDSVTSGGARDIPLESFAPFPTMAYVHRNGYKTSLQRKQSEENEVRELTRFGYSPTKRVTASPPPSGRRMSSSRTRRLSSSSSPRLTPATPSSRPRSPIPRTPILPPPHSEMNLSLPSLGNPFLLKPSTQLDYQSSIDKVEAQSLNSSVEGVTELHSMEQPSIERPPQSFRLANPNIAFSPSPRESSSPSPRQPSPTTFSPPYFSGGDTHPAASPIAPPPKQRQKQLFSSI